MSHRFLPRSAYARNVLTLITGTAIAQAIPIALSPILTRLFSPESFGLLATYVAVVTTLGVAATARYELAVILPESDDDADAVVALSILVAVGFAVLCLAVVAVFHPLIAGLFSSEFGSWLYVAPVSVAMMGGYNALYYWLNRRRRYRQMSANRVLQAIATVATQLGGGGVRATGGTLILGQLVGPAIAFAWIAATFHNARRARGVALKMNRVWRVAKLYRNHPSHLLPAQWAGAAALQIPILVIGSAFGVGTLGMFSLAERVVTIPTTVIAGAMGDVYRQQASEAFRRTGEFRKLFLETCRKTVKVAIVPFALLYMVAPDVFAFVFGDGWRMSGEYARILLISAFVQFVFNPVDKGALIVGATRYIMVWHLVRFAALALSTLAVTVLSFSAVEYMYLYVTINVSLYVADILYQYRFSYRYAGREGLA